MGTQNGNRLKDTPDLYTKLGINKRATEDEIKKAYRTLALKFHPDKNPNDPVSLEKFKEINRAHHILTDPKKRKIYDNLGDMGIKMCDQLGEDKVAYMANVWSKRWVKYLAVGLFVLTCGCFGCFLLLLLLLLLWKTREARARDQGSPTRGAHLSDYWRRGRVPWEE